MNTACASKKVNVLSRFESYLLRLRTTTCMTVYSVNALVRVLRVKPYRTNRALENIW